MTRSSSFRKDTRTWRDSVSMQKHAHWYVDLLMNQMTVAKLQALEDLERVARANHQQGESSGSSSSSSSQTSTSSTSSEPSPNVLPTLGKENLFLEHLKLDPRPLNNVFPLLFGPSKQNFRSYDDHQSNQMPMCRELAEQMRTMVRKGREMEERRQQQLKMEEEEVKGQSGLVDSAKKPKGRRQSKKSSTSSSSSSSE